MISPKYLQTKHSYPNQTNRNIMYDSSNISQLNFLDQFKLKKPPTTQYIKSKGPFINSCTPGQKLNKQFHQPTQNLYTCTSPKNFVNSFNSKDHFYDKNQNKTRSKEKSVSHRSRKSPLRKIVKSQSQQMLYDPIQRVFKVIQQEQKARQSQKLNQKTLKHLQFIPTFSELNDSFLDIAKNIQEVKSQKNFNQIKSLQKKKSTHDLVLSRQYHNFEDKNVKKNQELNRNRIKKTKSVQVLNYVVSRRNLDVKISASKVKNYFSLKQENQKKNKTIRNLLENMGKKPIQQANLRKVNSENEISQISLSQPSKLQSLNEISHRKQVKYKMQVQPYEYSQSGQSSNYNRSHVNEQSNYEFQMKSKSSQKSINQKRFIKTNQRTEEEIPLDLKNMKMYVVDPKDIKKSHEPQQQYSLSQSVQNYENSTPSIEEYIHSKQINVPNSSYLSSKKSVNSESQNIQSSQSSNSSYQPVQSVNTPAYRNGMQKRTQKNSIINEFKNVNLKQKEKPLSVSSRMSKNQLIEINSKINKNNNNSSNKHTLQVQKEKQQFLKTPKIQSSSIIDDLSNLIDNSSKLSSSKEKKPEKRQVKKEQQIQFLKIQSQANNNKMKTTPKLSTFRTHELSEFEIIKQSQKELTQKANNSKRIDNSVQISNESDLGLKSKRSIVQQQSQVQRSNEIPIHSSVQMKSLKKSIKQQSLVEKKEESKKVIKFLKVTSKKNEPSIQPLKIQERIEQQRSQIGSKSIKSQQSSKELVDSVRSQNSSLKQQSRIQNKSQTDSKNESESNKSKQSNKSVEGSSFSQSSQKSSELESSQSNSVKKSQKISRKEQECSESSYSESSYSRTLTKSVTNNLSRASSPNNISKSSMPNQQLKLQRFSKESQSQSLVDSSYNNSSQTSLSNSTSNNILRHSTKKADNFNKKNESMLFKKKKNFAQYTLNDVARLIQEHEFRIQAYCLYVDNSKSIYEQDYQLQKIQLLTFLMLKKSVYELNRAIDALNGKGPNVFCLTDIEIQDEPFEDYRQREQITQQRDNMVKSKKQTFQELKQTFLSFEKKYSGQKGFNLTLQKDDMSSQIVKKLSQQLNLLYEKWQQNKSNDHQLPKITKKLQKRMMQIIELIFLTSQLDGQKVKGCELFTDTQTEIDFRSYYEKWFQKIIQTIEYFDGRKSINEQH